MSGESEGAQPANETLVAQPTDTADSGNPTDREQHDIDGGEQEDAEAEQQAPEDVEVDYEGEKFRVPTKLKEALLRQADYSRNMNTLAEQRKALEAEREGWGQTKDAQQKHFNDAARIHALNDQIDGVGTQLKQYENVDWNALFQSNPEAYHQHKVNYDQLKDRRDGLKEQRDTAARAWTDKEKEYEANANRTRGERIEHVRAELPKLIEGWTPELDLKMATYGTSQGLSQKEMTEAVLQNPKFAPILQKAMLFDAEKAKAKTQQTFEASQTAKPVTRVGGNGGSAQRRTTDASGDQLSTEEWAKRETARLAALRQPSGRR